MTYINVPVDLDEVLENIDDEDLVREVEDRGLKVGLKHMTENDQLDELRAIHHLMRMKQPKEAYKRMYNYVRDVLGKAI